MIYEAEVSEQDIDNQLASRGLDYGQPPPLRRVCCPKFHPISTPRAKFWAATFITPRMLPNISFNCTSQQKVDTFFIFYTLKTEHSTPYIVLVSNSLMSMQVFLH